MRCTKEVRLGYTEKAAEIVGKLTLEEKVSLMGGNISLKEMIDSFHDPNTHYNFDPYPAGGLEKYGVPPMLFCDGPRGVVCGNGKSTAFPVSMLRGASFDTELEQRIGEAIGEEVNAFGGNLFAGVCINLPYNPGWGRSQETYGEESFLLGAMGSALVRGVQEKGVMACVKHYAFNQMEISRFKVSVDCDVRTEREVFLPHFKDCVDAGAASVMSSYNLYKGTHCGHHDYLLNQVLCGEWDFDGFIMSDFGWGVRDTVEAANGGQNMEMCCTEHFGDKLVKAVKDGLVPEEKIDAAALRIVRTILAFEDGNKRKENASLGDGHIALALESARKGITLIKNADETLPLDRKKIANILVLGKQAISDITGDHGSSQVHPPYVVNALKGIADHAQNCEVIHYSGENSEHAVNLAKAADAVVFVVGYDHRDEGEYISEEQNFLDSGAMGGDRKKLALHEDEIALINAVGPVNGNSVVVLIGGNTIMLEDWKESVSSIMMAYYPGMEGGNAIAEILFGEVNPSGKLPFVIPMKETDLPQVNWDTDYQFYDYYHGYAKLEKEGVEPSVPFGFGLSYTSFALSSPEYAFQDGQVVASCQVKNTGDRVGDEVIQMYVGFKNSSVDRPVKLLRGFQRVHLAAGESARVSIRCSEEKLRWYNPETRAMELERMEYEVYIGTSSRDLLEGKVLIG